MIDITHLNRLSDEDKYEVWLEVDKQGLFRIFSVIEENELLRVKWPASDPSPKDMAQVVEAPIGIINDWHNNLPYDVACCELKDERPSFKTETFCFPPERKKE